MLQFEIDSVITTKIQHQLENLSNFTFSQKRYIPVQKLSIKNKQENEHRKMGKF